MGENRKKVNAILRKTAERAERVVQRMYRNCRECGYSAYPHEILGQERKHFWPHSLECVRCGYRTETKPTWDEAKAAWNAPSYSDPPFACPPDEEA